MKKLIIIFLFISTTAFGQCADSYSNKMYFDREQVRKFTDTDTLFTSNNIEIKSGGVCKLKETSPLTCILWMEVASGAYSIFDYIGYNSMKNWSVEHYRFIQGFVFGGTNYVLAKNVSYSSAAGFSIQVWGGVPDLYYYGIDKLGGGFGGFSNGNEFNMHKNLSQLNFMPTVLGSKKVRGIDLITNVVLSKVVSWAIQYINYRGL